ncbi:MAG TPA: molybdate ABC transporter substrate-binding protein [Chloroflexota bacterium]|jgi:molybdate transport system substrate-binding protein|nr:molybdate ABC transporter substrate-binding protein [Chloroflexota bacterium]
MKRSRLLVVFALLSAAVVGLRVLPRRSASSTPTAQATLTVFAASSLTDAFMEIGRIFEAQTGTPVRFNFGASTQLRTQLEQGAGADIFASADTTQMHRARQAELIAGSDQIFATNRLVIITPATNPAGVTAPEDLATPGVKIVTAQADVPIGEYTQTMFEAMSADPRFGPNFKDRANANIVSREPNVRQIVAKIQLGEGDAAVVYRSDVTPSSAPRLQVFDIPDDFNTLAEYPIAMVANAAMSDAAARFINLVLSPEGQDVLQRWNFLTVAATVNEPATAGAAAQ